MSTEPTPAPQTGRNARRIAAARKAEAANWKHRLREELEARDAERNEEIALRDAEITRLQKLADRRWVAWQSARRRHGRQRDALREAMAADRDLVRLVRDRYRNERDAARRERDADRDRILRIVAEWAHSSSEYGGLDSGDLIWDLETAGYTLPTTETEETTR